MKPNIIHYLLTLIIATMITACASTKKQSNTITPQDIEGKWWITHIHGKPIGEVEERPFIQFNLTEKSVNGSLSCNLFHGGMEIDIQQGTLSIPQVAATRRMCQNIETEQGLSVALPQVHHFTLSGNATEAQLFSADGKEVVRLQKE